MNAQRGLFSQDEPIAWKLFQTDFTKSLGRTEEDVLFTCEAGEQPSRTTTNLQSYAEEESRSIALDYAKLDGFDVVLRTLGVDEQARVGPAKYWVIPVRAWARNDEWRSEDAKLIGSHGNDNKPRPEYIAAMEAAGLYEGEKLKDGLLDPECIEARDWSLSAGQHKPFDFAQLRSEMSVTELVRLLRETEHKVSGGLDRLLAMVEGQE